MATAAAGYLWKRTILTGPNLALNELGEAVHLTVFRRLEPKAQTSSYFLSASSAMSLAWDNCASSIATLSSSMFVRFSRAFLILRDHREIDEVGNFGKR